MPRFIEGLKLSELFYREAVAPIVRRRFPRLRYSAGLLGCGSECLGFDDRESSDHHWGLRLLVFLSPEDHAALANTVSAALSEELPVSFRGYSTNFSPPDPNDNGVRHPAPVMTGPVNHMIEVRTARAFFQERLGIDPHETIADEQWVRFPQQSLLEVTAGRVFHDGLRELKGLRRKFNYYPRHIWLRLMGRLWRNISEEEAFVGRTGFRGDELGSALIAARQVQRLMELCFLIERRYAPYSKWSGTAFAKLKCGRRLGRVFDHVLAARDWHERERWLSKGYQAVAAMHNALRGTPPAEAKVSRYFGRPYLVIHADRIAQAIERAAARPMLE